MANLERCSYDALMQRNLFMLELASPNELPRHIDVGSKYFGTFVAWDARAATHDGIASLIKLLIAAGCVSFVCWGPDCERVHDIVDECDPYKRNDSVIMTTWHADESFDDAVWYFLNTMFAMAAFEDGFRSSLAISVGSESWARRRFVLPCATRGHFRLACWQRATYNKSLDASGGSAFLN